MSRIDHPCITKILEVYDDNEDMFVIVMEYAAGGELFDQVKKESEENILTESTAKLRFYQISNATAYLHKENVCHRDLKLENILMMKKGLNAQLSQHKIHLKMMMLLLIHNLIFGKVLDHQKARHYSSSIPRSTV